MSDINYKELFEHYYQKDYDFNTSSLSAEQIKDIKADSTADEGGLCISANGN